MQERREERWGEIVGKERWRWDEGGGGGKGESGRAGP